MYCPNCGTQNENDAKFCGNCGRDLGAAQAQVPAGSTQTFSPRQDQNRPYIPNHLIPAILVTLFCCIPTGIVSIVYAAQVNGKIQAGDIDGARRTSGAAKTWAWVSFGLGLGILVLYAFFGVAAFGIGY